MKVSEIFMSVQGEGRLAGTVATFIRLAGCNLRCRWCDTPYALEDQQGEQMTIEQMLEKIDSYKSHYVVVTGGEPLICPELPVLMDGLKKLGRHTTLETSATQYRPVNCDLVSISPKLEHSVPIAGPLANHAQSHKTNRLNIEAIQQFIGNHDCQLKFVVECESDLTEIEQILTELEGFDKSAVLLMPQARTRAEHTERGPLVAELCIKHGYRYCPRLQVELWSDRRGR